MASEKMSSRDTFETRGSGPMHLTESPVPVLESPSGQKSIFGSTTAWPDTQGLSPMDPTSPARSSVRQTHLDKSSTMSRLRTSMMGKAPLPPLNTHSSSSTVDTITSKRAQRKSRVLGGLKSALGQVPSIALIAMFHLMIGIPFGVSYFPMYWSSHSSEESADDDSISESGPFPLPGKEALGIRMFLFSTIVGQLVFTFKSQFPNPIGLQMVENVPFTHELSAIVIAHQGFGVDALSTLMIMFGLSSIVVGLVFWLLGKLNLGRIVYFFPTHVLIGCIGGIGLYIAKTGVEVTIAETFSIANISEAFPLLSVVLVFEFVLRILEYVTKDKFPLLSPIYFCMITPVFYLLLAIAGVSVSQAEDSGFFFPSLDSDEDSDSSSGGVLKSILADEHVWDIWKVIHFPTVSWTAIWASVPTLVALTLFSLIHVPINIPAFALSTNTDADMNNELVAHGYSNILVGLAGSLQNYMAYTQSVVYDRSGGKGRASGVAVAVMTAVLFFAGPTIASYIPRCMAGTLLLHVGMDLFLEGVWDTIGRYDPLEYGGIWLIVVVMTLYGMEAAMIAGVIAAVSTYSVQSLAYVDPIRGSMKATTLRSSCRTRGAYANSILDSRTEGRSRILVVQLHGHLFFGNLAGFTESMRNLVSTTTKNGANGNSDSDTDDAPFVVIMDFCLVLGIDSSAAQAIIKMKDSFLKKHNVELCIFVTGCKAGFPTEFNLTEQLSTKSPAPEKAPPLEQINEGTALIVESVRAEEANQHIAEYTGSRVCESLDEALILAEDALISKQDPSLLQREENLRFSSKVLSMEDETAAALMYLRNICPVEIEDEDLKLLFSLMQREVYKKGEFVWEQDSVSDCAKLLVHGMMISELEEEAGTTETINQGNLFGEVGLVNRVARMSSVRCHSDQATVYSLNRASFDELGRTHPHVARLIDLITINYLVHRVQNVSNRIFETRCLPI